MAVPSLNEFHAEYKDRGVKLFALSAEGKKVVSKFVDQNKVTYPVAIDPGGKAARMYGVRGIPHAFVVGPSGDIVWRGNPGDKDGLKQAVESALEDVLVVPMPPQPHAKLAKVGAQLDDFEFGAALKSLARLTDSSDEELATQARGLTKRIAELVERRSKKAEGCLQRGEYYEATQILAPLGEQLGGSELADGVEELAKRVKDSPDAKDDLAAGKLYEKAMKHATRGDFERARKGLRSLQKKYPDTAVASKVDRVMRNL